MGIGGRPFIADKRSCSLCSLGLWGEGENRDNSLLALPSYVVKFPNTPDRSTFLRDLVLDSSAFARSEAYRLIRDRSEIEPLGHVKDRSAFVKDRTKSSGFIRSAIKEKLHHTYRDSPDREEVLNEGIAYYRQ